MKFLRHLGAATLVIAVVVLAGLAWNHFWPGTLAGQLAARGPSAFGEGVRIVPGQRIVRLPDGIRVHVRNQPGAGAFYGLLRPANLRVIAETAKIEAVFILAVVIIDVIRRRLRRGARRNGTEWNGTPGSH